MNSGPVSAAYILRLTLTNAAHAHSLKAELEQAQAHHSLWSGFRILPAPLKTHDNTLYAWIDPRLGLDQYCLPNGKRIRQGHYYQVSNLCLPAEQQPLNNVRILYPPVR